MTWIVIMETAAEIVRGLFVCDLDKPGPLDRDKTVITKFCECMRELENSGMPREKALNVRDVHDRCEGIVKDFEEFRSLAHKVYIKGEWLRSKRNPSQEDVDKMDVMDEEILRLRKELTGPYEVLRQKIATLKTDVENGIRARVEM